MKHVTFNRLHECLDDLARRATLIAPRRVEGMALYRPVGSSEEIAWEADQPVLSAKAFFFPPTECLLKIDRRGPAVELEEQLPEGKQVLFGLRPCDARGVTILDALFLEAAPRDPYYAARRSKTTMIGIACREMGPTCFCTAMGGGPDDTAGLDLLLHWAEDGFFVQEVTAKGRSVAVDYEWEESSGAPHEPVREDPFRVPPSEAWPAFFDSNLWSKVAERCLSCRICAYVCPTCRCFDLRDELLTTEDGSAVFERIRCWDSCSREGYRATAGGHDPRVEKGQRLRNRMFCKFYYYPQEYGTIACTGCGRCVDRCPVNIDLTEIVGSLALEGEGRTG